MACLDGASICMAYYPPKALALILESGWESSLTALTSHAVAWLSDCAQKGEPGHVLQLLGAHLGRGFVSACMGEEWP